MSQDRKRVEERGQDAIPRVRKEHLRDHAKTWTRSTRRGPARADGKGALAIVVLADGKRIALFPDSDDFLRVKELDR